MKEGIFIWVYMWSWNKKKVRRSGILILLAITLAMVVHVTGLSTVVTSKMATNSNKLLPIYGVEMKEKKVAISFDAAWGAEYTEGLLDILDEFNIKTTFFLVGIWVDEYPELVKEIAKRGHEIGNHSSKHPDFRELSKEQIAKELNDTNAKIEKLTGQKPILFRPPFGEVNNQVISVSEEEGFYVIKWSVDSLDWQEKGVQDIVDRVTTKVHPGAIILFHNNGKYTAEALRPILQKFKSEGYKVVPISELIYKKNYEIDKNTGFQRLKKGAR